MIPPLYSLFLFFFFNDTATTEIYTLSLHDALPIFRLHEVIERCRCLSGQFCLLEVAEPDGGAQEGKTRSEEHTSELQSQFHLVCRLLLEKKKKKSKKIRISL